MGLKKNFGYNLILTLCNYLFPLIVYPYISRVLKVDNIGICNFVDNIINYFVIFSLSGISLYGVREIARNQDNPAKLNSIFSTLVVINIILTLVSSTLLIVATLFVDTLQPYREFLWIGLVKLVFSVFLIEWFYQGMSMFKFITIRSVLLRFLYIVSIFIFVHKESDVLIYFSLYACITVINGIINWQYSRKYVKLSTKDLAIKNCLKPVASFGYYHIMTSMYTSFNVVYLGFVSTDAQVGYFATASKLNSIIMSIFTALTTVMIPHISTLLMQKNYQQLEDTAKRIIEILFLFALPVIYYCYIYASDIIYAISGPGYEGAIVPFKIVISLILIIGIEQITVQQFLMASTKSNRPIMILSTAGAAIGIIINLIFTPKLSSIGSSISWSATEICVLILSLIFVKKYIGINIWNSSIIKIFIFSIAYIPFIYFAHSLINNIWVSLFIGIGITIIIFCIINYKFVSSKLKEMIHTK